MSAQGSATKRTVTPVRSPATHAAQQRAAMGEEQLLPLQADVHARCCIRVGGALWVGDRAGTVSVRDLPRITVIEVCAVVFLADAARLRFADP